VPLKSDKNQELYLDIKIMVGPGSNSQQFLIFQEPRFVFKKFAMLKFFSHSQKLLVDPPESQVIYFLEDVSLTQIFDWVDRSFILNETSVNYRSQIPSLSQVQFKFLDVRTQKPLIITAQQQDSSSLLTLQTDSLEQAGDLA
jgi:hypothetical protein